MKKNRSTIRQCEIVSKLKDEEGHILFDLDNAHLIIRRRTCIEKYSFIVHDKDTYTEEDEKNNPLHKQGTLKPPHVHLLLKFDNPQHFKNIASWFDIPENFINKIKGRWENAVVYQVHRNAPEKYQYSVDEVTANFDVQSLLEKFDQNNYLDNILQRILNGEICEYNKPLEIDQLTLVHCGKIINDAIKVRQEYLQATVKDRNTECIYITGTPQAGKTTLAKKIAAAQNLVYFVSSSSNDILCDYKQEPCIILDELRPTALGLADLLKFLDNHTVSSVKSRYRNKFTYCKLIIITSVLDIDTFYSNVFQNDDEPIIQLKRRCGTHIRVRKDKIFISLWDAKKMDYSKEVEYENNILDEFIPESEKTEEDVENHTGLLAPFLKKSTVQDGFESIEDSKTPFDLNKE